MIVKAFVLYFARVNWRQKDDPAYWWWLLSSSAPSRSLTEPVYSFRTLSSPMLSKLIITFSTNLKLKENAVHTSCSRTSTVVVVVVIVLQLQCCCRSRHPYSIQFVVMIQFIFWEKCLLIWREQKIKGEKRKTTKKLVRKTTFLISFSFTWFPLKDSFMEEKLCWIGIEDGKVVGKI